MRRTEKDKIIYNVASVYGAVCSSVSNANPGVRRRYSCRSVESSAENATHSTNRSSIYRQGIDDDDDDDDLC